MKDAHPVNIHGWRIVGLLARCSLLGLGLAKLRGVAFGHGQTTGAGA